MRPHWGVRPGALDNQSVALQEAINRSAQDGQPLFMPAGDYLVSNIDLPSGITIVGVPGRTRIRYAGDGHLMFGTNVRDVRLEGLVLDGNNRPLADYAPALLHISTGANIAIEDCAIQGSLKDGVTFDRVAGRIERSTLSGILGAAFQSNDAQGLAIRDNVVSDCSDNGILVYRWSQGRDGTIITGNRIERIRAVSGGTGPYGNGINVFRADDVIISGNMIHDCDFSAVRCNAASNVQMVGNTCTQSGEVAMFAEFGFQGAIVANNVIDGAANGIALPISSTMAEWRWCRATLCATFKAQAACRQTPRPTVPALVLKPTRPLPTTSSKMRQPTASMPVGAPICAM